MRMTIEEAIKDIKENIKPVVGGKSLDIAIEALEKQNAKKVRYKNRHGAGYDTYNKDYYNCPSCGRRLRNKQTDNHCGRCGQKLDWGEPNE